MPKTTAPFAFVLWPRPKGVTAERWLYESLRAAILEGRLALGSRLPTTRELSKDHRLARGTVVTAFENLKAEGYVHATVGSGTYVACVLPETLLEVPRAPGSRGAKVPPVARPARLLSAIGRRAWKHSGYSDSTARAFRIGQPALDLFPTTLWAQVASRRLRLASQKLLLGCGPMGYEPLREAVAEYLVTSRGVHCTSDQVAIVSGSFDAMNLSARLLLDPGDRVAFEDPGYGGMRQALEAFGATIVRVPVDDEGMVVDAKRMKDARLVYVTPAHQHPMGVSMSATRRLALLEWASCSGATIFEDDYDSEYRYSGPPMPALQGLDRRGLVIFSGSFSKVLFPSLRLGYVVVPPDLVDPFASMMSVTQRHAHLMDQAVLADFISGGHFGRHIRRMREVYAERHSVLVDTAKEQLAGRLSVCSIQAGLQTVGWLPAGIDGQAVVRSAVQRKLELLSFVPPEDGNGAQHVLLLGFAAVDAKEIRRGVRELGEAIAEVSPARRAAASGPGSAGSSRRP